MNGVKIRKFEIQMIENKDIIYIASGNTLEEAFLNMAKFINKKYIQGDTENGYSVVKRHSKAI